MKTLFTKNEIVRYLHEISQELERQNVQGEIILFGGAVMAQKGPMISFLKTQTSEYSLQHPNIF
jgi:hypothetical protein